MNLKEELTELINKCVIESESKNLYRNPLVGFSSADDPMYKQLKEIIGPHHLNPQDILPDAKTVVSFFIPFSKEIVSSNRKGEYTSIEWAKSYIEANALINYISQKMIEYLKGKGISADTVSATHTFDKETLKSGWSHRSAAYISGLGKFGVNRMLITPEGCAGRFGSVIISQEIQPTNRIEEEFCIYYKNGGCLECINACPVNALHIDDFDRFKCYERLLLNANQFTDIGLCDVCGKCVTACPYAINKIRLE